MKLARQLGLAYKVSTGVWDPKRPGPDMKKADRISRMISLKTVCCFQCFVVSRGDVPPKSAKNIFDQRLELLPNRVLRKFESYMMGKTGFGIYGKTLCFLAPEK